MTQTQWHNVSRRWAPIAALVVLLLGPGAARAESVVLAVTGSAEPASRDQIAVMASAALATSGWRMVTPAPTARQSAALESCVKKRAAGDCAKLLAGHRAERGLVLLVDRGADPAAPITLTGYLLGANGTVVATEQRFCETAEIAELEGRATDLIEALVGGQAGAGKRTLLQIRSKPADARVMVDNEAVGVTPLDYGVVPGRHKVSVDKEGFEIEVREVEAPAGTTQSVDLELRPILAPDGPVEQPRPRARASRWPARLTLAAGVIAIAAGVTLILIDASGQGDSLRDPDGTMQRFTRDSKLPGMIAAGAGVVGVGTGIYLFVRAGRADREAAPTAQPADRVVGLGLTGGF